MTVFIFHHRWPDEVERMRVMARAFARWLQTVNCNLELAP